MATYSFVDFRCFNLKVVWFISGWLGSVAQEVDEIRFHVEFLDIFGAYLRAAYPLDGAIKPLLVVEVDEPATPPIDHALKWKENIPKTCRHFVFALTCQR